ncbi:MAG: ATP-binding protein, partial [Gammaproteobacteria bacterium]
KRARDLIAQMLAFSRGETREVAAVELATLLAESLRMLRPMLPSTITLDAEFADDVPPVRSNEVQIQQVVLNLCINARDALPGGGTIRLGLRHRRGLRAGCASCHVDFAGDFAEIVVADDGSGIASAEQERIFEPFFSTKPTGQGSGMGLAMVHGTVHGYGGHVLLDSTPGRGTRFSILLPLDGDAAARHGRVPDTTAGATVRVLVVDEAAAAAATVAALEERGHAVTLLDDTEAALARFLATPDAWDLVISEQSMPGLTGAQLATRLLAARAGLPVIVVSDYSTGFDAGTARALGLRDFLAKPLDRQALLDAVEHAVGKRG